MSLWAEARKKAGLTIPEAAKKLGLSQAVLRSLEDGGFAPDAAEMAAFNRVYGRAKAKAAQPEDTNQLDLFAQ